MTEGPVIDEWTLAMQVELEEARKEIDRLRGLAWEYSTRNLALEDARDRLRAELQTWQQRFGDCEATLLRQSAVVEAAREASRDTAWCRPSVYVDHSVSQNRLRDAIKALDAVPRRAASPEPTAP